MNYLPIFVYKNLVQFYVNRGKNIVLVHDTAEVI